MTERVVAAFVPLVDCAVLVAAREQGFAASEGIDLTLVKEPSWAGLLRNRPAKINLIPFNPFSGNDFSRSRAADIERFQERLRSRGLVVTIRKTRGDDIDAACGQLAGRVHDRVRVRLREKGKRTASL
jgi:23S rRNA (adenine2503-C2)-methyltransferase